MKNKRGSTILIEQVLSIILNVIFIVLLISFVMTRASTAGVLNEKYAKEIALALDAARPGMIITIYMKDAIDTAQKSWGENNIKNMITLSGNTVTVGVKPGSSYSYSFFNNITIANHYLDTTKDAYIIYVGNYNG